MAVFTSSAIAKMVVATSFFMDAAAIQSVKQNQQVSFRCRAAYTLNQIRLLTPKEQQADLKKQTDLLKTPTRNVNALIISNHDCVFDAEKDKNKSYAEYEITLASSTFGQDSLSEKMRFKKWYNLARKIHEQTTKQKSNGLCTPAREIHYAFENADDNHLAALEAKFQALKSSKNSHIFSGRASPETIRARAELLTQWLQAFKKVAGDDQAKWHVFTDLLWPRPKSPPLIFLPPI